MIELKKLLYTYREAGEILSVSKQTVRRAVDAGDLEIVYVGKRDPRVTADSLREYVRKKVRETGSLTHAR